MDLEQWQRVTELFDQAGELPESERALFLEERCAGHPTLRRQVERLLAADDDAGDFLDLEKVPHGRGPHGSEAFATPGPGDCLGSYKLLREIGSGGMGVVYLASRSDETFQRQVAVKLIRQGRASEDARRRLRIERQVLASLDHPNIAALHDGGTTGEGLPYFVMEYVEGVRIDEYCDQNELTLEERLDLFLEVCDAVEEAHRSLVVHRDLKPSNILVTAHGVPKLLDFGIAKLLKPDLLGVEDEATEYWMRVLTWGYASPEQVHGRPITTASDVYSLGVLLFKLLTGRLPWPPEPEGMPLPEAQTQEPEPPLASEALAPDPRSRKLSGDLDSILSKALRASPRHRYGTVKELTEDLRRYENHLPVLARKGNLRYQAGKFLRRHRLGVGIAALFLAFILVTAMQWSQVREQHLRAEYESNAKNAVIALFVQMFETANVNLNQGPRLTVLQTLDHAQGWLDDDTIEPEVQVLLSEVVGRVYLSLENPASIRQFQRTLELLATLHGEQSLDLARVRSLYGQALRLSDLESAIREGQRAVEMVERVVGEDSPEMVGVLNEFVTTLCYKPGYEHAVAWVAKALDLARHHFRPESLEVALALANHAVTLERQGRLEEAAKSYQDALAIHQEHLPDNHPVHTDLLSNLANIARAAGDLEESERIYDSVLRLQRQIYAEDHPYLGRTLINYSNLLFDLGRVEESVEALRESVGILERTLGADHSVVSRFEIKLTQRLAEAGKPEAARGLLEERLGAWQAHGFEKEIAAARAALADASGQP